MKKRTAVRIITFLSAALLAVSVTALQGHVRTRRLELYTRSGTQRAFDELVTSVSELSNTLEKSIYVTDPSLESALCTQMFGRAVTAQTVLGELPWSSGQMENVSGFLSRVGDYACSLARTVGENGGFTDEELANLMNLSETASVMRLNLQDMQARVQNGRLTMDEVYGAAHAIGTDRAEAPLAGTAFQSMETEFPELPTLIYDGPFSEGLENPEILYLQGMTEVDEDQSRMAAARFLGVDERELTRQEDLGGNIPCRCFSAVTRSGEYTVCVTRQGGQILSALCSRMPGTSRLSVEDARKKAEDFAKQQGLPGLAASYHMEENGVLTVNFQYKEGDVLFYPDLVKVSVAMDTGAIMNYDAKGYLSSHHDREMSEVEFSREEARAAVSPALTVEQENLAVIPSPGGEERLCHEFVCRARDGKRFVVYVNAVTGVQEKILILLEDSSGTLTV